MQLHHEIVCSCVCFLRVAKHVRSWSKWSTDLPQQDKKAFCYYWFLPAPFTSNSASGVLQSRKMKMTFTASPCVCASAVGAVLRAVICAAGSL